ncbi:biliverdin-producing heme oxygenase [Leifsonia sp. AG29]|uniref:biliverdin-producing heme oxygenase n=1 Tax=Leifsonia sp. AG29 TaxID=2598860 RepID=UPI00131D97D2|nr:biliverdin-producing heme oxygenase [Leifsonia sp. AG29]
MTHPMPFSQALRERTRSVHEQSEGSSFVQELMAGDGSRDDYVAMLAQHYFIYRALENGALTMAADPVASLFLSPELDRLPAIEADLAFLLGPDWAGRIAPLPSTARYAARIDEVGESWPGGFVAHHYTRYLGDLSGGQIIRTILQRQYGFGSEGVGFYAFPGIAKPKAFKDAYRARLDAVDWPEDERDRVVAEVGRAFRFNTDLFVDLARAKSAAA